ncbi:MAG: hypothetical protein MUE73_12930, partial [Planctomycetes bacterium]|nr:hypothetical protein [Planctomycetota bacterium]
MAEIADSIRQELLRAHPWPSSHNSEATVAFSRRLCPELALKFAEALRLTFPSIQPDPLNRRAKLYQRAPRRLHRLAVSFCAPEEALGLGISIKSLFLRDVRTGRFKVKLRRLDDLLRAEADDYHRRQPHAVLV